jgi:signal transduction histidine kinase
LLTLSRQEKADVAETGSSAIRGIIEQVVDAHSNLLRGKDVKVRLDVLDNFRVQAPEPLVQVALGNLFSNACKYTQEGEIHIVAKDGAVSVLDSGPGVSAADAARLFNRHFRAADAKGKGHGIGLAIVARLCQLYGWQVGVAPREPHGLVATIVFNAT